MDTLQNIHILQGKYIRRDMELTIWGGVAAAITGAVGSVATALFYRSLTEAKVKSIVADTYDKLITSMSAEITSMQQQLERLRARVEHQNQKELHYLETITELTKKGNRLELEIIERENKIKDLETKILKTIK